MTAQQLEDFIRDYEEKTDKLIFRTNGDMEAFVTAYIKEFTPVFQKVIKNDDLGKGEI